jgi:DNA helicase-2/ATP-dependent DNA helicase PcrA
MDFKPTEEQQAIVAGVNELGSLMIRAYAGCAKTSTLELAAKRISEPCLSLAFNVKIAKDMAARLPGNFVVKTMNGLGHGAWARTLDASASVTVDGRKLGKLVTLIAKDRKVELLEDSWVQVRDLAQSAMNSGIVPITYGDCGLLPDRIETWAEIAEERGVDKEDFGLIHDLAHEVLVEDIRLAKLGTLSFDDQVYCSALLGGRFPKFPRVMVDEAQDLSPLNHRMLALALAASGRLMAVGDERQAIYAFRGASGRSMELIEALRPEWQYKPLQITFRCPKAVVARQQLHAPGFRAFETNAEGRVEHWPGEAKAEGEAWSFAALSAAAGPRASIAMLCRNNAPLLTVAFRLLAQGVGVVMLGRDIGAGLKTLAKKISPSPESPIEQFLGALLDWERRECDLASANGKPEKIAGVQDRADCLRAVASGGARDCGELCKMLERLFARESGQVTLSSIHRAKGLEWDCVVHLDPWRLPSKWAKRAGGVALEQERNLLYVCETRTRDLLVNANVEDFQ